MHFSRRGYSTIIALLMTAFLIALSSGIFALMLRDMTINRALSRGIATYAGAEWALEYALLKVKNHESGFEDAITPDDDEHELLSHNGSSTGAQGLSYEIEASGTAYSDSIAPGAYEIIPLFIDEGNLIQTHAKHPDPANHPIDATERFELSADGELSWNILATDTNGTTVGTVGTISGAQSLWSRPSAGVSSGTRKSLSGDEFRLSVVGIADFVSSYDFPYLILYNYTDTSRIYTIDADTGFSYPMRTIIASSRIADIRQNIRLEQEAVPVFEALKWSFFSR